jgi:hypothetical protein
MPARPARKRHIQPLLQQYHGIASAVPSNPGVLMVS